MSARMTVNRKKIQEKYDSSIKGKFRRLKYRAKAYEQEFNISIEQYKEIVQKNECFYCKGELARSGYALDRIDNDRGYTTDNVVACCFECNALKSDKLNHVEMIAVALTLKKLRAGLNEQK